jgi:adenosylcobinamide-phosphate synthase
MAVALDAVLPEPPRCVHPVVWMGRLTAGLERLAPRAGRLRQLVAGAAIALLVPAAFAVAAGWAAWGLRELHPVAYLLGGGMILKTAFSVRGLATAALNVARSLEEDDLDEARVRLRSLVGRDAAALASPQVAGAAVESVAENATDGYAAPWMAFALLGFPGVFAYRAVNTLDSMIGYRGRHEWLGKASARLDDAVNWAPARVTSMLSLVAGWTQGLALRRGWTVLTADAGKTASPNAGWTMSAVAGLLGVTLEKPGHYRLGEGMAQPSPADVRSAVRLSFRIAGLALAVAGMLVVARDVVVC